MKLALVSPTPVPPTFGGMDRLLEGLAGALRERHPTDLITIPFDERSREGVLRGYVDFHDLDLSAYDRVITYKAPAYMVRHPNQVLYLSHRLRVFYDLYEPRDEEYDRLRRLIHFMDGWALDKSRLPFIYTVGETVTRRLMKFGGIVSTPLHHPSTFIPAEPKPGEHFLSVGRLHPWKRIDLLIRAFKQSRADAPLVVAGEGPQEAELRELAAGDSRIKFVGKVSDEDLAGLYARAIATIFPPISEDMGLITFESFLSGKPILTTPDAGEPPLIVEQEKTGFVADATPEALAERIDWMASHRAETEAMGEACREWMKPVTWGRLVDALLAAGDKIDGARSGGKDNESAKIALQSKIQNPKSTITHSNGSRPDANPNDDDGKIHLLVTDNQIIDPPVGGGRVRILELYRHMPEDFTTIYIGAFDYPGPAARDQTLAPNFREILTPLTAPHFKMHHLLNRLSRGEATIDVTMPILGNLTPRYRRLIEKHLAWADVLALAHPWMLPFLPPHALPLVYDSQNCEALVKEPLLRRSAAGRWIAHRVKRVERETIDAAKLVLACSEEDAEAFARLYGAPREKIMEVPNGVDCAAIRPATPEERAAAKEQLGLAPGPFVIFTGSNYQPNLEGAETIIGKVAPELRDATFGIAGGVGPMWSERHRGESAPPNVRLFGFVERATLLDIYRAADVALNPMAHGSGTNIKMLDYMAAGLPIIASAVGARGLRGAAGEHWALAEADALAGELRALLAAPDRARELGAKGRELAERRYDWASIAAAYAERLRPLARRRAKGAASTAA